jgi:succinate dehydrogenase/fumarate reductase-like Fe-S protein
VPDLTLFYKQYKSIKPYLQRDTPSPDVSYPSERSASVLLPVILINWTL